MTFGSTGKKEYENTLMKSNRQIPKVTIGGHYQNCDNLNSNKEVNTDEEEDVWEAGT